MKRLIVALGVLVALAVPARATRIFTTGFEENNATNGAIIWTEVTGYASVGTTGPHSGTYVGDVDIPGTGVGYFRTSFTDAMTTGTYYIRFYIDPLTYPTSTGNIFEVRGNGGIADIQIRMDTSGNITLVNLADSSTITGPQLSTGTWYRVEVKMLASATVGTLDLLVDGVNQGTPLTGKNTLNGTNVAWFYFGMTTSVTTFHAHLDDIAINDGLGTFQTDYPGPGKIAFVKPAGDTSIQWLDETSGPATYANINSLPGVVTDASYNKELTTLDQVDKFSITSLPSEIPAGATIKLLDVYARIGSNQISAARMKLRLWDESGSSSDGPNVNCVINGFKMLQIDSGGWGENFAYDTTGKTKANVNSFSLGYINVTDDATRPRYVSELYANVEWIESGAPSISCGRAAGQ